VLIMISLLKLLGLAKDAEVVEPIPVQPPAPQAPCPPNVFDASRPIPPLDPNRFAETAGMAAKQLKLDSQRIKGQ
jgi:hypothetical protein